MPDNTKIVRKIEKSLEVVEIVDKKTSFVYFRVVTKPNEMTDFQVRKMYQQRYELLD